MTGVIVRSAANVEAGAKTRLSAILHGRVAAALRGLLAVPADARAAGRTRRRPRLHRLQAAGNPGGEELLKESKAEFAIFFTTALGVVLTDLLAGVLFGIGLTAIRLLYRFSHIEIVTSKFDSDGRRIDMRLEGAGTFLSLPRLATALKTSREAWSCTCISNDLYSVDHAIFDLLHRFKRQYEATGGTFTLDYEDLHVRFRGRPNRSNDT